MGLTLLIMVGLVLTKALQGWHYSYLHVADEETKTQQRRGLLDMTQGGAWHGSSAGRGRSAHGDSAFFPVAAVVSTGVCGPQGTCRHLLRILGCL